MQTAVLRDSRLLELEPTRWDLFHGLGGNGFNGLPRLEAFKLICYLRPLHKPKAATIMGLLVTVAADDRLSISERSCPRKANDVRKTHLSR